MTLVSVLALVVLTALLGILAVLLHRLSHGTHALPVTAEWIDDLSAERYRPMLRLLDSSDLEFLRAQPGYSPAVESKLRAQRCQIFRGYLRHLTMDFRRVCMALKLVMAQSDRDRPDLAAVLVQHQIMFASGVIGIQARLVLYRWGLCSVDVTRLVQIFDVMRIELRNMIPATEAACA